MLTNDYPYDRMKDMGRLYTKDEFIELLEKKAPEWELLGEYTNARTRTLFRHKICGAECQKIPFNLLSKPNSCRVCNAKRLTMTPEEFREKVKKKTGYELLTDYAGSKSKIKIRHKTCGHEFWTNPSNFIRREEGCPYCKGKTISRRRFMTHEQFIKKLGDRAEEYEFITRYKSAREPIRVKHLPCGNEFDIIPDNMLRGSRCKSCKYSTGEGQVFRFIRGLHLGVDVVQGDRTHLLNGRELDIWVPELKIAIEYDGVKYHTVEHFLADEARNWTYAEAAGYHLWKTKECEKQGIRLVHIFEDEWIEHRDIVEDKLRAIFNCPMKRYYARKLELRRVGVKEARTFFDANHIQGWDRASVTIGLYDGETLIAAQSFLQKGDGKWDLVRYATLLGTCVIGGFTKCLKWFEREYTPHQVRTFADRRWCSPFGDVYKRTGFTLDGVTRPSYWYVKGRKRYHKSNFRKSKLAKRGVDISGKTEKEIMGELKYQRIYDCGLYRYIKSY